MKFVAVATAKHLAQITNWLEAEHQDSGQGFHCNLNIIQDIHADGRLSCLLDNGICIAFVAYQSWGIVPRPQIVEVHPKHRGKGVGRLLIEEFLSFQTTEGKLAVEVECSPWESNFFWRKLGFMDIPEGVDTNHHSHERLVLYRPAQLPARTEQDGEHHFELWDKKLWAAGDSPPRWEWHVSSTHGEISPPLIHPCNKDWKFRWSTAGTVRFEDRVKRLRGCNLAHLDQYVILDSLPIHHSDEL